MSDFRLALAYLRSRPLVTILTTLSVALALCLATVVLVRGTSGDGDAAQ